MLLTLRKSQVRGKFKLEAKRQGASKKRILSASQLRQKPILKRQHV